VFCRTNQDLINSLVSPSNKLIIHTDSYKSLKIYHQNIRGLKYKTNELISSLESNLPHLLCLTEHHLNQIEMENISTENYKLGAQYCRKQLSKGGTCIFVHEILEYDTINLKNSVSDLDIEDCAIKIQFTFSKICIDHLREISPIF
jgi:hypothetical protein